MRYIDTGSVAVPENWVDLAKRTDGVSSKSLWSYFKVDFEDIVGKKCWYSESVNSGADNDVDHFRPKAQQVAELTSRHAELDDEIWALIDCKSRTGYPFLALEFSNYRYCCTRVNSGRKGKNDKVRGKVNFFPLQLASSHGSSVDDYSAESHCFLDPCDQSDVELLVFNSLGNVEANKTAAVNSWAYCRVMVSIEVFHLHYHKFVERRLEVWQECERYINLADQLNQTIMQNAAAQSCFKNYIFDLQKRIDKKSEYSAVAIDCIKSYKNSVSWLDQFFPDAKMRK